MCNKPVGSYTHTLEFVPDCYMTQEICHKIANTLSSTIQFVSEFYKCYKAFNKCFLAFFYILDWYKTQEMCDRITSDDPFCLFTIL